MVFVVRFDDESFDSLYRRWRNLMDKSGIVRDYKRRSSFLSRSQQERLKRQAAARRRARQGRGWYARQARFR